MIDIILTQYDGAILGPIAKLLGWIMNAIFNMMDSLFGIQNIGLCIILFTIVIYMCMFPLTYKQQKFSKMSAKMSPELNALRKKYEGKQDQASLMAMQDEQKAIYEKYGAFKGGILALWRIIRCNPFSKGGYDPVP